MAKVDKNKEAIAALSELNHRNQIGDKIVEGKIAFYTNNDKKGGTYLYFCHANKVITYSGIEKEEETPSQEPTADTGENAAPAASSQAVETSQTGTAVSGGYIVLAGAVGIVLGGLGGFFVAWRRRKS